MGCGNYQWEDTVDNIDSETHMIHHQTQLEHLLPTYNLPGAGMNTQDPMARWWWFINPLCGYQLRSLSTKSHTTHSSDLSTHL